MAFRAMTAAEVRLPGGGDEREDHHRHQADDDEDPAGEPHGRDSQQLLGNGPLLLAGLPGGGGLVAAPERLALLDEQPDADEHEEAEVDQRLVLVEGELGGLADDGDGHGGEDGGRQAPHAAHDGGGQRRQEHRRSEPGCGARLGERPGEGDAGSGQHAGQGPHQGREAPDADAEESGPFGVLGHGPHGHAGAGEAEERRQPEEQQDGHLDGEDLGEPERRAVAADPEVEPAEGQQVADRSGAQLVGERQRVGLGEERQTGDDLRRRLRQEPGHHDRDHRQHEPWGVEEAPHQRQVEDHADERGEGETQDEGDRERHVRVLHEVEGEDGARRADGRLGEVDHPQGAVDEDDAGGGEGVDEAEDEAPEQDRGRRAPAEAAGPGQEHLRVEGDDHRRQRPAHRSTHERAGHFCVPCWGGAAGRAEGFSCPRLRTTSVVPCGPEMWISSLMMMPPNWGATM